MAREEPAEDRSEGPVGREGTIDFDQRTEQVGGARVTDTSLQETYAPDTTCFGCGPKNEKGLRIRSIVESDEKCVCVWRAEPHHAAFPGVLNGGICAALLDCHSNWTAAWHLMRKAGASSPPCTVTAELSVKLRRPTPLDVDLVIRARVVESDEHRATIEGEIEANGAVTVTSRGVFVAVKEGHPAFHRW